MKINKNVISAAVLSIACTGIFSSHTVKLVNAETSVSDNEYTLDEGFDPDADTVHAAITATKIVDTAENLAGQSVRVTIDISGDNVDEAYCSSFFHIYLDERLEIVPLRSGKPAKAGDAVAGLSYNISRKSADRNGFNVTTLGSGDFGLSGTMYIMDVLVPDDAEAGDVYYIDVVAEKSDIFRKFGAQTDESKNMEAYLFTKGIFSKNNPSDDIYLVKSGHTEADGYIAVVDEKNDSDSSYKAGDANGDNNVTLADAVLVLQAVANADKYGVNGTDENHITEQGVINGDVYEKGSGLTAQDALHIQKYLLKLINTL